MTNDATQPPDGPDETWQAFEFETVRVDDSGKIVERREYAARQFVDRLEGGTPLEMVMVPGGTFLMGSAGREGYDDERPQHSVSVPPFFLGRYPVTQEQWKAVMGWIPRYRCKGARRPADRVSWDAAQAFCERLSRMTGRRYRLPSEAKWEYACRAGTTTPFYFGDTITTDLVNYVGDHVYRAEPKGVYRHETIEVGSFPPNAFGLYDMHGTVWEWCADVWHRDYVGAPADGSVWEGEIGSQRVLRGGCWHDPPGLCRSAARLKYLRRDGEDYVGFRVALTSLDQDAARARGFELGASRVARRLAAWFHR
jgi:formylglycine-generating enzyme required for sulfatase activity